MSRRLSVTLLTVAAYLSIGLQQAKAVEAARFSKPTLIYTDQFAQRPASARTVYAERSNMGGGFIEFLFGDGQARGDQG